VRAIVTIAESDAVVIDTFQSRVSDGDAKDVSGKVLEHAIARAGVLAMNDPWFSPGIGRNVFG
jgi:hypothetical protein